MIQHRFSQNDPIPLFLVGPNRDPELSGIGKVVSSEVFRKARKAALVLAAVAIVLGVASVGKVILFANVTASPVIQPSPQEGVQSTPATQSTASADVVPGTQMGDELAPALKSTLENRAEVDQARAEALFNQFQAWAAEKDAQALPARQQPVEDVRTDIVQFPPLPKRRPTQITHTARSQDSSQQNSQSLMRLLGFRN